MHILINSDILFTSKLVSGHLPSHLDAFARECDKANAVVVLTRTVLLEVERRQQQLVDESVAKVENAYAILRNAGVPFEERSPAEMFSLPDFAELFRQTGVRIEIEEASLSSRTQ